MRKIILMVLLASVFVLPGCRTFTDALKVFSDLREDVLELERKLNRDVIPVVQSLCANENVAATCKSNNVDGAIDKIRGYLADANYELSQDKEDAAQAMYNAAELKVEELKDVLGL